jgi:hypothetical protein
MIKKNKTYKKHYLKQNIILGGMKDIYTCIHTMYVCTYRKRHCARA